MSIINIFQISLEIWGCMICIALAIFSGTAAFQAGGALKSSWSMLLLNCLMLASDSLAYVFQGDMSTLGLIMTRTCNFSLFLTEGLLLLLFSVTIQQIITGQARGNLRSIPLLLCLLCVAGQLTGLFLTPFTGLYYSFDEVNLYVRGSGNMLSFILPGISLIICVFWLLPHRKQLSRLVRHALSASAAIFLFCYTIQFLWYGMSLVNIATTLALLLLHVSLWIDHRNHESEQLINTLENTIGELQDTRRKEDDT